MSDAAICHYRLSRTEYDRAVEAGAFDPEARLELINGELHAMTPQGSRHATGVGRVTKALWGALGAGFHVRVQVPLAVDDYSEPEPDVAVVAGTVDDYENAHPTTAVLVVEVADDSLHQDRTVKQRLYARAGIPEYWILALPDAQLEIYRDPGLDGYSSLSRHGTGENIAPQGRPEAQIRVDELLPKR